MSRTPRVTGAELTAALANAGFRMLRVKGSHHFLRHQDGRNTVVPSHSGEIIGPGLLHKILRDCQMTAERLSESISPFLPSHCKSNGSQWLSPPDANSSRSSPPTAAPSAGRSALPFTLSSPGGRVFLNTVYSNPAVGIPVFAFL